MEQNATDRKPRYYSPIRQAAQGRAHALIVPGRMLTSTKRRTGR